MIRKTMRLKIRKYRVRGAGKTAFRYMVTTWWLLFIPLFTTEKYLEAD